MLEEVRRRRCCISSGTLYPLLYGLQKKAYLRYFEQRNGKSSRSIYTTTPLGRKALQISKSKIRKLFGEMIEGK